MEVNFNNLRAQACYAYDRLCNRLNAAIRDKDDNVFFEGYGWIRKGEIIINPDHIQQDMESLRSLIGSIAMVFEEGREDFKDVYPQQPMAIFNPEEDEIPAP